MAAISEKAKENQRKYKQDFAKKNYSRVPLDVPKEYHEYLKTLAKANNMSLTAFIREAIEEKAQNVKEELPPEILPRAMKWLQDHGHSPEEITDFIQFLGAEQGAGPTSNDIDWD